MIVDWIASVLIIIGTWMIGDKNKWGQIVVLIAQPFFWVVIYQTGAWGLIPTNLFMIFISIRNTLKWFREDKK